MNYNKLSSLPPSTDGKNNAYEISFVLSSYQSTDDSSKVELGEYLQPLIHKVPNGKRVLQGEAIRRMLSYHKEINFQSLLKSETSIYPPLQILPLQKLSDDVRKNIDKLYLEEDENNLYDIADSLAEWFINSPDEYHVLIIPYLFNLPLLSKRIFMAALSDAGFSTCNEELISSASLLLKDMDKRLAQTGATFLLTCCGKLGSILLMQALAYETLPHSKLIRGIVKLISP